MHVCTIHKIFINFRAFDPQYYYVLNARKLSGGNVPSAHPNMELLICVTFRFSIMPHHTLSYTV